MDKNYLTVNDVGMAIGVSPARAYQIVHSEGFPALKIGRKILVPANEFAEWMNSHRINCPKQNSKEDVKE